MSEEILGAGTQILIVVFIVIMVYVEVVKNDFFFSSNIPVLHYFDFPTKPKVFDDLLESIMAGIKLEILINYFFRTG